MMKSVGAIVLVIALASCTRGLGPNIVPIGPGAAPVVRLEGASGYKTIFSFDGADGSNPKSLLLNVKGTLYGTSYLGGDWSIGGGTVFALTPDGQERVLHNFGRGADGREPAGDLLFLKGTFYGMTISGGKYGEGTVFGINAMQQEHVLHSFGKGSDGKQPMGGLALLNGVLYGTTSEGGTHYGGGTVFSITTAGVERVIYDFDGSDGGGSSPRAGLTAVKGLLYGTTFEGGSCNAGTAFSVTTAGKQHLLHTFSCYDDGSAPAAKLIAVKNTLYGTTFDGGDSKYDSAIDGTVFSLTLDGKERVLHSFGKGNDGQYLESSLVAVNGTLFGVTLEGGTNDKGIVFSLTQSGTERILHNFGPPPDGYGPSAGLLYLNGTLYGTASEGGKSFYGGGAVFKISPAE
jgi:uncharacterized repeat protein (TIGR03803 family)